MASRAEYEAAAKVPPSQRTAAEAALVAKGSNIQSVRNANHDAKETERTGR